MKAYLRLTRTELVRLSRAASATGRWTLSARLLKEREGVTAADLPETWVGFTADELVALRRHVLATGGNPPSATTRYLATRMLAASDTADAIAKVTDGR